MGRVQISILLTRQNNRSRIEGELEVPVVNFLSREALEMQPLGITVPRFTVLQE